MKILIAADMEGISGVTTWDQVTAGHFEYARFRRIMTEDVNAAAAARSGRHKGSASPTAMAAGRISWSRTRSARPFSPRPRRFRWSRAWTRWTD
jgi:hypothetical protein